MKELWSESSLPTWVADLVIIELKAIQTLAKEHEVKLVNYLAATGVDDGLLLNFWTFCSGEAKVSRVQPKGNLLEAVLTKS